MSKQIHHTFLHFLLVAGVSLFRDALGLAVGVVIGVIGIFLIYSNYQNAVKLVLGVPISLIAATVTITNLEGVRLALFSRSYQINNCPFCRDK